MDAPGLRQAHYIERRMGERRRTLVSAEISMAEPDRGENIVYRSTSPGMNSNAAVLILAEVESRVIRIVVPARSVGACSLGACCEHAVKWLRGCVCCHPNFLPYEL